MRGHIFRRKPIEEAPNRGLQRILSVWDLTAIGVAAIVGAGIFSTVGEATQKAGPSVILVFVIGAFVAGLSALSYAEMASAIPQAGSAYTYTYVIFGEITAWLIGWFLILEYAVGNIAVAISWSGYFVALLRSLNIDLPPYLIQDPLSLWQETQAYLQTHNPSLAPAYAAWYSAPRLLGIPIILNLPALLIVAFITILAYAGIRESRLANNLFVVLKVGTILGILLIGAFFVNPDQWTPFMPNGFSGTMRAVGAVFFAYIGFDALSTTAEEARHPRRDLPLAMLLSLTLCTLLYVGIALVLTGVVSYRELGVADPLAYLFTKLPISEEVRRIMEGIVAVSAVVAMASVLLVFQIGQPRIWFAMSQDGLLPAALGKVHKRFGTPHVATLLTGLAVGIPLFFSSLSAVVDMTSMGTLMAFAIVSAGVARLHHAPPPKYAPRFRVPYIPGRWLFPALVLVSLLWTWHLNPQALASLIDFSRGGTLWHYRILLLLVLIATILAIRYNLSLLPLIGTISPLYLIIELGQENWIRLLLWLAAGLILYFVYGYWHSHLRFAQESSESSSDNA